MAFDPVFVQLPTSLYVSITDASLVPLGDTCIIQNTSSASAWLISSPTQPMASAKGYYLPSGATVEVSRNAGYLWGKAITYTVDILVQPTGSSIKPFSSPFPDGVFEGLRAITTQSYVEANIKNGLQFNASRRVVGLAAGSNADSILLIGNKPVILKSRNLGYTGSGLSASVFKNPIYTGGTPNSIYNNNDINPQAPSTTLLTGFSLTSDGELFTSVLYSEGNESNQGQGSTGIELGEEIILSPNTAYLLRVTSLDTQPQNFNAYISWYEGSPDLPIEINL